MKVELDEIKAFIEKEYYEGQPKMELLTMLDDYFFFNKSTPCECYKERITARPTTEFERGVYFARTGEMIYLTNDVQGVCTGTKEVETCTCGGDRRKCNFYKEKSCGRADK